MKELAAAKVEQIGPTITPLQAAKANWDVIVVGAGPAGARVASKLACHSFRVLLVDKSHFPRWKVCGCCLTQRAQAFLADQELTNEAVKQASPLESIYVASGNQHAHLSIPGWIALSRERMDAALVRTAIAAGCAFLPGVEASVGRMLSARREVTLRSKDVIASASAKLLLAADGLGGRLLAKTDAPQSVQKDSKLGAGAVVEEAPRFYRGGTVFMTCGRSGYLGIVRLEDGRLDMAAAFDPTALKSAGNPAKAAAELIRQAGWPAIPASVATHWRGTVPLTRRSSVPGAERILVLGDAAGYVEPFTGEGMTWALASADSVLPFAVQAVEAWESSLIAAWARQYNYDIAKRQQICRSIAWGLRHPLICRVALGVLQRFPSLAAMVLRRI